MREATFRHRLEYVPVWLALRTLQLLPRSAARALGIALARLVYLLAGRLRRVGMRNLELAMPQLPQEERNRILRGLFTLLGRLLADFALIPRLNPQNRDTVAIDDGLAHLAAARDRGKGVLMLTAHLGGWEMGSYGLSTHGFPMHVVVRDLDNPYVQRLVAKYRCLHGNVTHDKDDYARGLLHAMKKGDTVAILMDTNQTPPQGVFVDFFGVPACTAAGLARVALHTDAAVILGLGLWDDALGKYKLHFDPALELIRTGDTEADVIANTQMFTKVIEDYVRRYPEQWLWIHRRWKTRPEGQPPIY